MGGLYASSRKSFASPLGERRHPLPRPLKLEQEGDIASERGVSDNNRNAKFYRLTRPGRRQFDKETRDWERTTAILARFLASPEHSS